MSSVARFSNQEVVNTFNLFLDTEKASIIGDANSRGDDVNIQFEGSTIIANDGELIRLTLTNFNMYNNFYHVDRFNSEFRVSFNGAAYTEPRLPHKNYGSLADLAFEFSLKYGEALATATSKNVYVVDMKNVIRDDGSTTVFPTGYKASAQTLTFTTPQAKFLPVALDKVAFGSTGNRLLDITFETRTSELAADASAHNLNSADVLFRSDKGDCYSLLGGERLDSPYNVNQLTNLSSSLQIDFSNTIVSDKQVRVRGLFPMQRSTEPYVYIRADVAQSGALETAGLSTDAITSTTNNSDITSSTILAKVPRDTEFINYVSPTESEYFINLQQRKLSKIRLYLTDSKNRPIGQKSGGGTSAGLQSDAINMVSEKQDTLGNLNFSATMRIDIIRMNTVSKLETPPIPLAQPARKAQNPVITFQDYGMPKFGV
jgi:hypothetical protein